ncbi:MAG: histidine phosphatase family protein [Phycisphaerales bacterium]|nr:histidine phosphatase family protein [Phycisphaerales bacterium]
MGRLLLMRHAKSSWSDPLMSDHDRPLNGRGKRDGPRMGQWLVERSLRPDLILSSTAERARSTAELVAANWDPAPDIQLCKCLYHSTPDTMLETIATECRDQECIMLVAHNPGIEDFLQETTAQVESCPTAVIAVIDFDRSWTDLLVERRGSLAALWRPKELPDQDS